MFCSQSDNCILIYPYLDIAFVFAAEFEEPTIGISVIGLMLDTIIMSLIPGKLITIKKSNCLIFLEDLPCKVIKKKKLSIV